MKERYLGAIGVHEEWKVEQAKEVWLEKLKVLQKKEEEQKVEEK